MENVIAKDNRNHPSKYLKADRPLYPCDIVENRYKNECYQRQTEYALQTQGNDFSKVFDLCGEVESDFRPACYQGVGCRRTEYQAGKISDPAINESTSNLCMLGEGFEARSNCAVGAVEYIVRHYYSDAQAKAFCEYLGANLRARCLQEAEEYYERLESPLERRGTPS